MSGTRRCIGGLTEAGHSLRLRPSSGFYDESSPLKIGEVWDLSYDQSTRIELPHVEDVIVRQGQRVGHIPDLRSFIKSVVQPRVGGISSLFNEKLKFTSRDSGYVSEGDLPSWSTDFWVPDRALRLEGEHFIYDEITQIGHYQIPSQRGLKYRGEPAPIEVIPEGSLVRVSLARLWKPQDAEPSFERRCYLQLSGWY